jgi:hypothetical protein
MLYLVTASGGPGFESEEEADYILQNVIIPSFEELINLKKKKKILAGGLPVGERTFVFIAEAGSNEELDGMLRGITMWGMLEWEAVPLQSFEGRAAMERDAVKKMRSRKK